MKIENPRSDKERRERQAMRYARVIAVAKFMKGQTELPVEQAELLAAKLNVSSRTIYRDVGVIRRAKEILEAMGASIDEQDSI